MVNFWGAEAFELDGGVHKPTVYLSVWPDQANTAIDMMASPREHGQKGFGLVGIFGLWQNASSQTDNRISPKDEGAGVIRGNSAGFADGKAQGQLAGQLAFEGRFVNMCRGNQIGRNADLFQ